MDIRMILSVFYDNSFTKYLKYNLTKRCNNLETICIISLFQHWDFLVKYYNLFTQKHAFVIYISISIHLQLNWIHLVNKHAAHDEMCYLYMRFEILCRHFVVLWNVIYIMRYIFWVPTKSVWPCNSLNSCIVLKQSRATPFVMMENVLQIQLSGERTPKLL